MPLKLGGCAGTRYGCCPDGNTAKVDQNGSNCKSLFEINNFLSGDVTIKKVSNVNVNYTNKLTFSKKNSKVLMYQSWSNSSAELNNKRVVNEVNAATWVKKAFRKVVMGAVPPGCISTQEYAPVICLNGKIYNNKGIASCAGQTKCDTYIPFTPTAVMKLNDGECPNHHKKNKHAECAHVFVIKRAIVNKCGQVVLYVSSENIVLPANHSKKLNFIKSIPVGLFHNARLDIDPLVCGSGRKYGGLCDSYESGIE
jgi:hypothetical protein